MQYTHHIQFPDGAAALGSVRDCLKTWRKAGWISDWTLYDQDPEGHVKVLVRGLERLDEEALTRCAVHAGAPARETPPFRLLGSQLFEDPDETFADPQRLTALVLETSRIYLDTPLRTLDEWRVLPLRSVPGMAEDFADLHAWVETNEALVHLWISDAIGRITIAKEIMDPASRHNAAGRKVCAQIEQRSGIPTYLYVWRCPYHTSLPQELAYRLGVEHKEASQLVLDQRYYEFINHQERLVSNISPNRIYAFADWAKQQST